MDLRLDRYAPQGFDRGRPAWVEALWWIAQALLVRSWLPGSAHRAWLLKCFGAQIGAGVRIKPGLRVKFPWRLTVGDHAWIGEDAWIDNLAPVVLGSHCCVSQGAYLCTGSHDWSSLTFDLKVQPIEIGAGAWIAARSVVGPGVTVGAGAVLALGSVATTDLDPWTVYRGVPAVPVRTRRLKKILQGS